MIIEIDVSEACVMRHLVEIGTIGPQSPWLVVRAD